MDSDSDFCTKYNRHRNSNEKNENWTNGGKKNYDSVKIHGALKKNSTFCVHWKI